MPLLCPEKVVLSMSSLELTPFTSKTFALYTSRELVLSHVLKWILQEWPFKGYFSTIHNQEGVIFHFFFFRGQPGCFLPTKLFIPITLMFSSGLRKWPYPNKASSLKCPKISAASIGPAKKSRAAESLFVWYFFWGGGFMSSSYETYWFNIRSKDACSNGWVNNLINYYKYLVVSPSKCPSPRAYGQLFRMCWRLPLLSYNGQDGVSLFPNCED